MPVNFFSEEIEFDLSSKESITNWLENVSNLHNSQLKEINYIFCSDNYLLDINKKYLNHDYYTDIITFDNSEDDLTLEGDIFISIDRVKENANNQSVHFENELSRVMVHGILHLLGFGDKTEDEKTLMREKEDACISLLKR